MKIIKNEYMKGCWGRWCAKLMIKNRKLKAEIEQWKKELKDIKKEQSK